MPSIPDRERAGPDRRREPVHLDGVARPGAQVVEREAHVPRRGDRVAVRAQQLGQLAQHPQHLALLFRLGRAQRVAELDHFRRLEEHRGAGRRLVVDDAADLGAGRGPHGDHVAAAPQRDARVGGAVTRVEAAEDGVEPRDEPVPRVAHRLTRARQGARGAVLYAALGVERLDEPLLQLLGRGIDPQRGGARRAVRQPAQVGRHDAGRGEAAAQPRERGAFERAPRDLEQLERRRQIGHRFGADRVVGEEQGGELGHLGEGGADRGGIGRRSAGLHPGGAERTGGVRRHPLQRGRKLECLQHGGGDPSLEAHTAAASSSRAMAFTVLPSARPLNFGITCPMTFPTSFAPAAIASRTARRISSGSTAAGRNSSSRFTSASS